MKEVLKKIAEQSRFEVPCFHGALHLQGRILSPSEAEAAGLLQYLIASQMITKVDLKKMNELKERAESVAETGDIDGLISEARNMGFRPEAFSRMSEQQDRVVCQVIRAASSDGGKTWNRLKIVTAEEQQDPDNNILWIGVLNQADRKEIISKAMSGHTEASEKLAGFFGGNRNGSF